jgi:hypothetical protein
MMYPLESPLFEHSGLLEGLILTIFVGFIQLNLGHIKFPANRGVSSLELFAGTAKLFLQVSNTINAAATQSQSD